MSVNQLVALLLNPLRTLPYCTLRQVDPQLDKMRRVINSSACTRELCRRQVFWRNRPPAVVSPLASHLTERVTEIVSRSQELTEKDAMSKPLPWLVVVVVMLHVVAAACCCCCCACRCFSLLLSSELCRVFLLFVAADFPCVRFLPLKLQKWLADKWYGGKNETNGQRGAGREPTIGLSNGAPIRILVTKRSQNMERLCSFCPNTRRHVNATWTLSVNTALF